MNSVIPGNNQHLYIFQSLKINSKNRTIMPTKKMREKKLEEGTVKYVFIKISQMT